MILTHIPKYPEWNKGSKREEDNEKRAGLANTNNVLE
jgi:hypothetical protein